MDLPKTTSENVIKEKKFYSDLKGSKTHAVEDAPHIAIKHLLTINGIAIDDANYERLVVLEKQLKAANSFQGLYENDSNIAQKYVAQLKQSNEEIVLRILKMCVQFASLLPLHISGWKGPNTQLENVIVKYIGPETPATKDDKFAAPLIKLLPDNMTIGLATFTKLLQD